MTAPFDAIVLTGGRARRLGGVHKPGLDVGGRSLAARVVAAVPTARRVIMVGPPVPDVRPDVLTVEDLPGGGPVAALAAGLASVTADQVATLAGDLPFLTADAVDALRAAVTGPGALAAAVCVDDEGRDQPLLSVWRSAALGAALAELARRRDGGVAGAAMRDLLAVAGPVVRRTVSRPSEAAPTGPPPWFDCDTESDLERARAWEGWSGREGSQRTREAWSGREGSQRTREAP